MSSNISNLQTTPQGANTTMPPAIPNSAYFIHSQPKQDTVEISSNNKEEKKGWSLKTKIAVGAGAVATAVAIAVAVRYGRMTEITKLAEKIEFTEAKNMDEAIKFAKENFKITHFDTGNDLELANWVNEGLARMNNLYKGKGHMPTQVKPFPNGEKEIDVIAGMAAGICEDGRMRPTLFVNNHYFTDLPKDLETGLNSIGFMFTDSGFRVKSFPYIDPQKFNKLCDLAINFKNNTATKQEMSALNSLISDCNAFEELLASRPLRFLEDLYSNQKTKTGIQKAMAKISAKESAKFAELSDQELLEYALKQVASTVDAQSIADDISKKNPSFKSDRLRDYLSEYVRLYETDTLHSTSITGIKTKITQITELSQNKYTREQLIEKALEPYKFLELAEFQKLSQEQQCHYLNDSYNILVSFCEENILKYPVPNVINRKADVFDTIYHEQGHLFHHKNAIWGDFYGKLNKPEVYKEAGKPVPKEVTDFVTDPEKQYIANTVSHYATTSPMEFVAEVYASLCSGHKFDSRVMKLYESYKGPAVPTVSA